MSDTRFLVRRYISEGWSVLPIPRGSKAPEAKDWVNREFTEADFEADSNIGVRLGKPSGGLTDVDLDVPEAVVAAKALLPLTERIHGRQGTGASHYWYLPTEEVKSDKWQDVDGKVLIEIRSTGGQTVLPGSIHPSGEPLFWEIDRAPSPVDPATLRRAARNVATAALLARHWPKGSRHVAARDAAGFLAARELDPREIEEIIKAAATAAGDDEIEDRARVARDTAKTFAAGGKTTGGPTLEASVGKEVVARLVKWFGGNTAIHDQMVTEMNGRHFYTRVGSNTVVATEEDGDVIFQREKDLYSWYANQTVKVGAITKGERKGQEITRSKFEIWREHPKRRQYRRVVFAPQPQTARVDEYNLWTGFAVQPAEGDCSLFLAHVRDNLCNGIEEHYEYLLDLMAFTVQNPGIPSEIAVVFRGKQGTGKGIFARNFGQGIFGRHYFHLDKVDHLTGHFNAHLSGKVVIFADEAYFAGDKKDLGTLKRGITEETLTITRKGIDSCQEPNFVHLFMATNEHWAAPAEFMERRFFILNVSDKRIQDHVYFSAIQKQMKGGGTAALLKYLLERPVTHDRVRAMPKTDELRKQQELTMAPEHKWWKECLVLGRIGTEEEWPEHVKPEDLHSAYLMWCDKMKINRRITLVDLCRRVLADWLGKRRKTKGVWMRPLLPLPDARVTFDMQAGTSTPWEEENEAPTAEALALKGDLTPPTRGPGDSQDDIPF